MRTNTNLKIVFCINVLFFADVMSQPQLAETLKPKVIKELKNYYGEGAEFDITVNEPGEVIISGSTSSYWDKRNMQAIVSRIGGVLAIRNELQVKTKAVPDNIIKANIESYLNDNMAILEPQRVQVQVENGVVVLSGVVNFVREASIAEDVASWQKGVKNVANKISVLPPEVSLSDAHLTGLIKGTIARFFPLEKDAIEVTVMSGRVTLGGTVTSLYAKKQIAKEVRRVHGVTGVKNQLKISRNPAK